MNANHKLGLAMLVGAAIGVAGATVIDAQQAKVAPGYFIAEIDATNADPAALQKYAEKVPETMAPFNHHYVVRGGKTQALEGEPPKHVVVIAFDSAAKAREWYDSPAYEAIKPLRQNSTKGRIFIAEGVVPE